MPKPSGSLNARRTSVAAPPVSGIAVVPSAYESETRTNRRPVSSRIDGRQAERLRGDDPEREVDRRADLGVRDGEQRRRVENPLEAANLAGHQRPPPARLRSTVNPPDTERDEQPAHHVADALHRR